ncbi:MAG TPA: hypothetical protein VMU84_15560 [Thermoanaerobaculia bacterium]|nr:hypothetical protein [Thermoanaerobaculia bacterium]
MAALFQQHAYPAIDAILASRFRQRLHDPDAEDIRADVAVRLIKRIDRLLESGGADPIESFSDYVAVVTFNAFDDFMQRKNPERARLKNRLRYAFENDPRLAIWGDARQLACGLREWHGRAAHEIPATVEHWHARDLADSVVATLREIGFPVSFEALVVLVAAATGITGEPRELPEQTTAQTPSIGDELENSQYLRLLWSEIGELPLRQRIALLLHARDASGESITHLLPATGIATLHELARTLEMSATELAQQWNELPFDDLRIADQLGMQRQQVINLRRSARDRLERRMRAKARPKR